MRNLGWANKKNDDSSLSEVETDEEDTVKSILKECAQQTSLHGIAQITSARRPHERILWLIVVLALTGYLGFQMVSLTKEYMRHPLKTTVTLEFSPLTFPAVSFCNMNQARDSKIQNSSQTFQDFLDNSGASYNMRRKRRKRRSFGPPPPQPPPISTEYIDDTIPDVDDHNIDPDNMDYYDDPDNIDQYNNPENINHYNDPDNIDGTSYEDWGGGPSNEFRTPPKCSFNDYQCLINDLDSFADQFNETEIIHFEDSGFISPRDMDVSVLLKEAFKQKYMMEQLHIRRYMGHQLDDMLISCSFSGRTCQNTSFRHFTTLDYGNCYTLSSESFVSSRSGPSNGLQMVINIEQLEYLAQLEETNGLRLVIHEAGSRPFPLQEGVTLGAAYETSIGLRMILINRLNEPKGACDTGEDFRKTFGLQYTRTACIHLCKTKLVMETCGCKPRDNTDLASLAHVRYCSIFDPADFECESSITEKYSQGKHDCVCRNPCRELRFQRTLSGREWPDSLSPFNSLMKAYCNKNLSYSYEDCKSYSNASRNINWKDIAESLLKVIIYYEDLNYEQITEEALYSVYGFIADIGGTLGLFIGASLVSIVELLQLILGLLNYCRKKIIKRRSALNSVETVSTTSATTSQVHIESC